MQTVVERDLEMRLVLSTERSVPVPARLIYRSDDPYAIHITFHIGSASPVHWTFARELFVEGVFRPCGHGDVRVWPTRVDGRNVVCTALSSPDGDALLEAPSSAVSAWLERTLRVVPPGGEAEALGLDEKLHALLNTVPDGSGPEETDASGAAPLSGPTLPDRAEAGGRGAWPGDEDGEHAS